MEKAQLKLSGKDYDDIQQHLFANRACEEAAFVFCSDELEGDVLALVPKELWLLPPAAFQSRSEVYLELTDETRAKLIKRAHDLEACLVEIHSHPRQIDAEFSWSDLSGFETFVPHIRWRLRGRPYVAIVFSSTSFDSLVWIGAKSPVGVCSIEAGGNRKPPTGASFLRMEKAIDG
ncbi:MAG: hypothetical protein Aurels2KO_21640 [Aureliella sp.]